MNLVYFNSKIFVKINVKKSMNSQGNMTFEQIKDSSEEQKACVQVLQSTALESSPGDYSRKQPALVTTTIFNPCLHCHL